MIDHPKLRSRIRSALARALYLVGALHLLLWLRLRNRAVVLMYHRVIDREDRHKAYSHPGIIVETPTFEEHLRFLRKHLRVTSLREFRDQMTSGRPFAKRTCLITFDDGWQDNYTHAFPLLAKYELPATVFLTSGFIGGGRSFWQESLAHSLFVALEAVDEPTVRARGEMLAKLGLDASSLLPDESGKAGIKENVSRAKDFPEQEREVLVEEARRLADGQSSPTEHIDSFLTWAHVREMAAGGLDFGSHTVNHQLLTTIPSDRAQEEVRGSRRAIEKELGKEIIAFSYPNGNCDAESRRIVVDNGFDLAFGTEPGLVASGDDRFTIKRINIHQGAAASIPLLMATIVGIL
jgi:peptidoglycan/xylan/chitin deacetylase (PgdA/CDA1 family)